MKALEYVVNLEIANGQSANTVSFAPPEGLIVGCCIYTNGAANAGFVTAKITDDQGDIYSPASDIRNYRDREAAYAQGKKPLFMEGRRTYYLEISSTAAYGADFKAQLVLVYENDTTKATQENC